MPRFGGRSVSRKSSSFTGWRTPPIPALSAWTQRTTPALDFRKVDYSSGLGVAAATADDSTSTAGKAITTTDGITWTQRNLGAANTNRYRCCRFAGSLNRFISPPYTASGSAIASAVGNAASWATNGSSTLSISVFEWADALGLGVGLWDTGVGTTYKTTTDGATWSNATFPVSGKNWYGLKYVPAFGLFSALAFQGDLYTSPDGASSNWTARTALGANQWWDMDYSPDLGMLCAVGNTGTNRAATSTNGTSFTQRAISARDWQAIKWIPAPLSKWLALGGDGFFSTSPDGITWTEGNTGFGSLYWCGLTYLPTPKRVIAVATNFGGGGTDHVMTADVV